MLVMAASASARMRKEFAADFYEAIIYSEHHNDNLMI
jgi:hypothetical protein